MARIIPFETFTRKYEVWFEENIPLYLSELNLLKDLIQGNMTVEIGCGSGRFAVPLGIKIGVEPSLKMAKLAKNKGLQIITGIAENLPLKDSVFDSALMVTTICFVDDVKKSLEETYRILKPGGRIVIGFVDRESELGRFYESIKHKNPFYKYAEFYSCKTVIDLLETVGFRNINAFQTLFGNVDEISSTQRYKKGCGNGGFVAIYGEK